MSSISPRVDIAFKKIFGVEENKDLLISLINSIVCEEDKVSTVTLLNPYNAQNFNNDKLSILDIKAEGETGKKFNIEIQITDEADYDKRALYYWAKLYSEQLSSGNEYWQLCKAIGIHILNFTSILDSKKYHNVFHIKEKETGEPYFTDLELHTIELKKFTGSASRVTAELVEKIKTSLDIWVAFLTKHELLNTAQLSKELDDVPLKRALTVLEVMSFSKSEREEYEDHIKWMRLETSALKKTEMEARALGKAEGLEQGETIGKIKAIEQVALNMLQQNIEIHLISQVTGLPIEKIMELK